MEHDLHFYQSVLFVAVSVIMLAAAFILARKKSHHFFTFLMLSVAFAVFVWPLTFFSLSTYNLSRAKSVDFCMSCHQMSQHIDDVMNEKSTSLAAMHQKRHWINKNPCYTCHTDYSMFGPIEAKAKGLVHLYVSAFTDKKEEEIKLYQPYPDTNCLQCHQTSRFEKVEEHGDRLPEERCIDCHDNIHKVGEEAVVEEGGNDG
ncbi:MAG: NapC/NirT family cytochrome c [Deltaproteobacteria bacterium]|nr:NapC/NirT family cytochrome c [Deltaproteobacteria bacterium]